MPYSNIIKKTLSPDEKIKESFSFSPLYLRIQLVLNLIKWFLFVSLIAFVIFFLKENLDLSLFSNNHEANFGFQSETDLNNIWAQEESGLKKASNFLKTSLSSDNILFTFSLIYVFFVIPLIFFYNLFYLKISNEYIFTDKRIIIKKGWLSTKTVSARHSRITDVKVNQSLIERILGVGTISINTAGGEGYEIALSHVSKPYELKKILHVLKEEYLIQANKNGFLAEEGND